MDHYKSTEIYHFVNVVVAVDVVVDAVLFLRSLVLMRYYVFRWNFCRIQVVDHSYHDRYRYYYGP